MQDDAPRVRSPGKQTERSRKSAPQGADASPEKRKPESTMAGEVDWGRAEKNTYTSTGRTEQRYRPISLKLEGTSSTPARKEGNKRREAKTPLIETGQLPDNAGRWARLLAIIRPTSQLGGGGGASPPNLAIPDLRSSHGNVPCFGGKPRTEVWGRPAHLKLGKKLATVNTLPPSGAGQSLAHQDAGETRSGCCDKNGVNSEESVTRCNRMSSKEKTRNYAGSGDGQGGGKRNRYTSTGTTGQRPLSRSPKAKPNAEGHIHQTNPKGGQRLKKAGNNIEWMWRNPPKIPAGRRDCARLGAKMSDARRIPRKCQTHVASWGGKGRRRAFRIWPPAKRKDRPRVPFRLGGGGRGRKPVKGIC